MKQDLVRILHVNDTWIISPCQKNILAEILFLQKYDDLTDEDKLQNYLQTRSQRNPDDSVILTQPGMIYFNIPIASSDKPYTNLKMYDTHVVDVLH